jgi:hypothetical protein
MDLSLLAHSVLEALAAKRRQPEWKEAGRALAA